MKSFNRRLAANRKLAAATALSMAWLGSQAAVPAARAQAAPPAGPAAPAIDPLRLVPGSTFMYMNINLDAGKRFMDDIKPTRLGHQLDTLITGQQKKNPQIDMVLGFLQGFGHQIGVAMMLPAQMNAAKPSPPEMMAIVPVTNMDQVKTTVAIATNMAATGAKLKWNDETEGANTIHVATGAGAPPASLPVYALVPGALVIGNSSRLIHASLRQLENAGASLAESARFKAVTTNLDKDQFAWGFISYDPKAMAALTAAGKGPDPMTLPGFKEILGAYQGASFSVALHPDRMEIQSIMGYDPESSLYKLVRQWHSTPLKAQKLAPGRSLFFMDIADMPDVAAQFNLVAKPMLQMIAGMAGKEAGGPEMATMMDTGMQTLGDIVNGSGNELALAVGAFDPKPNHNSPLGFTPPAVTLMIEKSENARLQKGIDSVLELVRNISGQKWYPKELLNTRLQILGPAQMPIRPAYGQIGDFHVFASDFSAIKTPLYLTNGNVTGKSLDDNPQFQKIRDALGPQAIGNYYIDLQSIIQIAMANVPGGMRQQAMKQPAADLGMQMVNALRQIGAAYFADPAGMGARMVLTYDLNAAPPAAK